MSDSGEPSSSPTRRQGLFGRIARAWRGSESVNQDVAEAIRDHEERIGNLGSGQRDMLRKVADFDLLRVDDVKIPSADIVALEVDMNLREVAQIFAESQHSRIPVYRETLDDPIGMVHVKDVLALMTPDEHGNVPADLEERIVPRIRRDILFVPGSMRLTNLLVKMQSTRVHLALVVDEYGGTDGLVSIEDLVEQIVGEIEDEHDLNEGSLLVARGEGVWEADARVEIVEIEKFTGLELIDPEEAGEVDTLGGLVTSMLGRMPIRGEIVPHPAGLEFEVLDCDLRRLKTLRVRQLGVPTNPGG